MRMICSVCLISRCEVPGHCWRVATPSFLPGLAAATGQQSAARHAQTPPSLACLSPCCCISSPLMHGKMTDHFYDSCTETALGCLKNGMLQKLYGSIEAQEQQRTSEPANCPECRTKAREALCNEANGQGKHSIHDHPLEPRLKFLHIMAPGLTWAVSIDITLIV